MYERDYLMQLIFQLIQGIRASIDTAEKKRDPAAAADVLEAAIGQATELDGAALLSLTPESIASVLAVSGTRDDVAEWVGRSLYLEAGYLYEAGNNTLADLRVDQAFALADAYGFSLDEDLGPRAAMEAYLAQNTR